MGMRLNHTTLAMLAFLPALAFGHALDDRLSCDLTAHDFVKDLLDQDIIQLPPMRVEDNSVNAFRPTRDADLTAFGLRVRAVFGYQSGDPLFKTAGTKIPPKSMYGVVVFGSEGTVKRRALRAGSGAVVHPVIPLLLTALICRQ
jgi:hypothetical protein